MHSTSCGSPSSWRASSSWWAGSRENGVIFYEYHKSLGESLTPLKKKTCQKGREKMPEGKTDVRRKIRQIIRDKGLIQGRVARRAGMSEAKLSQILTEKSNLNEHDLESLCRAVWMSRKEVEKYVGEEE